LPKNKNSVLVQVLPKNLSGLPFAALAKENTSKFHSSTFCKRNRTSTGERKKEIAEGGIYIIRIQKE
jgi:hypothetical protein